MANSETVICNQALGHLGTGKEIVSLSERSKEAQACTRYYTQAVEEMLRAFAWPFATKIRALALVEEDPNEEWAYSYQMPSDCLYARRILSGSRNDTRASRVPYRVVRGDSGRLIYTDKEDAELEYTTPITDASRFPPDFVAALSWKLASLIAPTISGGDDMKSVERCLAMYERHMQMAMAASANEEQADETPVGEFVRARDFTSDSDSDTEIIR